MQIETTKKWCVLVGAILIQFCIGVPFLFGNLLTYIVSYLHYRGFYDKSNIGDENWIVSPYPAGLALSSAVAGLLTNKLGIRLTLLLSNLCFTSGYFLTYLSLEHSLWLPILTYGLICGLGTGIAYVTTIDLVSKSKVSTVTSLLIAGFSCGAAVFNQVVSFYVNPDNLTPDIHLGSIRVFNQTEVLERVPNTFLLLGGIVFILQVIGIILSFTPTNNSYAEIDSDQNDLSLDYTPLQVAKDPGGIILWWVVFMSILAFWGIQLVYKNFGQTFISDDHFLSSIGTVGSILSAVYRIGLSLLADKFGTKIVYVTNAMLMSIFTMTLYAISSLPKAWYFIWTTFLFCAVSIPFVMIPSMVRISFGAKHFAANFGLIWSGTGIVGFIFPVVVGSLKQIGWENTIFIIGAVAILCFLLSCFLKLPFLPTHQKVVKTINTD